MEAFMQDLGETLRTITAMTLLALIVVSSYIGASAAVSFLGTFAAG